MSKIQQKKKSDWRCQREEASVDSSVLLHKLCWGPALNTVREDPSLGEIIYNETLDHSHKKGKENVKGTSQCCISDREADLEQKMLSTVCLSPVEEQPLTPLTQSQSGHSSVYVKVSVTFPAAFPLSWIPSTVPFHNLASSPRNQARWRGNSWEGMIVKSPYDSTEGPEIPFTKWT